jgi:tetratricopeptide (TPR) repeat protein
MIQRRLVGQASLVVACLAVSICAQGWDHAISLFNQKQYRPAIREFHTVLRENPNYWQAWYYIGFSHFQLKDYEDSIDSFQNYIKAAAGQQKEQATGNYFVGFAYYDLQQYDKSIPPLSQYCTLMERLHEKVDPTARAALGRAYVFTNKFAEAVTALTPAAAEMKTNANNHYYIGFAQYKLGHEDLAVSALNQALGIDAKDPDSLSLLGDIYLGQSRKNPAAAKQAIQVGERLATVRDNEHTWSLLGQAYLIDQQYAKAAVPLEKFARAHADSGPAWFNLGLALSRSEKWKPAENALEQAVKLSPANGAAQLELGYVYEKDKQYDKALTAYQRAYEISGNRDNTARDSIDRVKQSMAQKE